MQLKNLVNDYYLSFDFKNLREETKKQYQYFLGVMLTTKVDDKVLSKCDYTKLSTRYAKTAYNIWCEKGVPMANHVMSVTRVVFNHGVREELCTLNPFASVRKRVSERRKVVWTREDVQKFLDTAYSDFNTRNLGLIGHMAYAWCQRLGDMRLLEWSAIDFNNQTVHIEQSKRKADVYLPIDDDLFDMLKQQERDFGFQKYVAPYPKALRGAYKPYSLTRLSIVARRAMKLCGLPDELRIADLRRTGTTEMVEAGVSMGQIMSVTGHANPQSVKPYMKNTLDSAKNALTMRKKYDTSTDNVPNKELYNI